MTEVETRPIDDVIDSHIESSVREDAMKLSLIDMITCYYRNANSPLTDAEIYDYLSELSIKQLRALRYYIVDDKFGLMSANEKKEN